MAAPKMHLTHAGFAAVRHIEGYGEPGDTPIRIELRMRKVVARAEIARTALALGALVAVRRVRHIQEDGMPAVLLTETRARMTAVDLYDLIEASGDWAGVEELTVDARSDVAEDAAPARAAA